MVAPSAAKEARPGRHRVCFILISQHISEQRPPNSKNTQQPKYTLDGRMFDQLGHSADEVAASLKSLGIKGVKHTVRFLNPIVRYVLTKISGTKDVDVVSGK